MKVLYHTLEVELYIDLITIDSILIQGLYNIYNKKREVPMEPLNNAICTLHDTSRLTIYANLIIM